MKKEILKVLFRKERSGQFKGSVTAIFPDSWKDNTWVNPGNVMTFDGCHNEGTIAWYRDTIKATPEEYSDLLTMLKYLYETNSNIELKIVHRMDYNRPEINLPKEPVNVQ